MTGIIALVLLGLGAFLFWFGYEVTSGKHKSDPNDHFFPLLGRNIDYVLGIAGIPMALGMFTLAFGLWADLSSLNYVARYKKSLKNSKKTPQRKAKKIKR